MRRRVLLLVTATAVALVVAGGVAVAATKECRVGVVCKGTAGNDVLTGTRKADTIKGFAGDDYIYGRGGADRIDGGDGAEYIVAGNGNDTLVGGPGRDTLIGEAGDDTYYATGRLGGVPEGDSISDAPGSGTPDGNGRDALRLDYLRLSDATRWDAFDTGSDPDANVDLLRIEFGDGRFVFINKYFDNLHADEDLSSEGPGNIETISFADDPSVDLAQIKNLIPY